MRLYERERPKKRSNLACAEARIHGALRQGFQRLAEGLSLRDKKTERLARRVRRTLPWLEPSDYPACRIWSELEVLATQVFAVLRAGSVVNAKGEGKRLLDDYRKLRLAQAVYSRELGMTPRRTDGH